MSAQLDAQIVEEITAAGWTPDGLGKYRGVVSGQEMLLDALSAYRYISNLSPSK